MNAAPYYADDTVTLYLGDMREVIPALGLQADLIVADPPYGETSLAWDRWPDGWPTLAATVTRSMWCFGSMRMFLDRHGEFDSSGWQLSQDVVWSKNAGTGFAADRFKRVHEHALHWYRGKWADIYHEAQRKEAQPTDSGRELRQMGAAVVQTRAQQYHHGAARKSAWTEDGTRLVTSVIHSKNLRGFALHPTEKPIRLLNPLIRYACPPGGLVLDPFAGSGSTLDAARQAGRRAIGIEANEQYAEAAARRLSNLVLGEVTL